MAGKGFERALTGLVVAAALVFGPLQASQAQTRELSATGELIDGVAAIVNEGVVLKSELREQMQMIVERLREQQTQLPPMPVLERQILERLVVQRIQLQRAERLGIVVPDEMLNRALAEIAGRNGLTLEQFPQVLAAEGIDYVAYRQDFREQMILEQLRSRDVMNRISVSEREIEQYLVRQQGAALDDLDYDVSHILVNVSASATPEQLAQARQRVDEIMARIEGGEDFAQLAVTYSDAQTALDGGALGWRKGSQLPTIFAEVVGGLEAGEIATPFRSGSGFHIVRVNDVRGTERVVVDQVKARHILLSPTEVMDDEAVRQRLVNVRNQILGGDDFGAIARAISEDIGSGAEGGSLGWAEPGDYVPEFSRMVTELPIGELSEPFRTPFGWHIVEVMERRTYDTTEDLQRRDAVMAVRQRKFEEEVELWIQRLRDEAFVEYRI
ncbi:MAG: peptidylprolyl isomerase [Gammaproteobacteria bacterium]|nr:peptidylprolyl isomerase [Gammaproteobacteria bacterium]